MQRMLTTSTRHTKLPQDLERLLISLIRKIVLFTTRVSALNKNLEHHLVFQTYLGYRFEKHVKEIQDKGQNGASSVLCNCVTCAANTPNAPRQRTNPEKDSAAGSREWVMCTKGIPYSTDWSNGCGWFWYSANRKPVEGTYDCMVQDTDTESFLGWTCTKMPPDKIPFGAIWQCW